MKVPFSPPYIDDLVRKEVNDVLDSGWITTGPKVKQLEELVAEKYAVPSCVGVNSWTSAAILLLKWWGVGEGDEVIIPTYTYAATALSVLHVGATPVMVDVMEDFTIDPKAVQKAITRNTKVVIPVDFAGLPCHYDALYDIINSKSAKNKFVPKGEREGILGRILIMADAAHSIGAKYKGRNVGTLADFTGLSFHAVKNITSAEGGMICINLPPPFNNAELYHLIRRYTLNGQTKDAFTKTQAGAWRYDIVEMGMKCNLPDLNAALALGQLKQYDELSEKRKRVHRLYNEYFKEYRWAQLPIGEDDIRESSYHIYPLRIKDVSELDRDRIIEKVAEKDVAVNVHFIPLPCLSLFKELGYDASLYPVANNLSSCEISLPIYPQLTDEHVKFVCESIINAVNDTIF
jgi:dTDP-4-amino-4,6-dideoxygalactose transaminase